MKSSENSESNVANHVRDKNVVDGCTRPDGCVPPPVCPPSTVCYPLWGRHECRSVSASGAVCVVVGRFYIALFSALEQTHCARIV